MKKKVIYLASGYAQLFTHNNDFDITYQDKFIKRDLGGDMLQVSLDNYDILIATPPCNYWSRGNYRRETSKYALETKHLLPEIIKKFKTTRKPFIVENVINKKLMSKIINDNKDIYYYEHGRHSYFTNIDMSSYIKDIPQIKDNIQNITQKQRQGGYNVNIVLTYFIYNLINKEKEL
jgi:site-specific DNA-cytosine methylase